MPLSSLAATTLAFLLAVPGWTIEGEYFTPVHRLPGIGIGRAELTDEALAQRTEAMIQSQTFSIMREPEAFAGARRIYSSDLQRLFRDAAEKSGFPQSTLQAIAYLESWGDAKAESPAGPKGIMQISEATGRRMGLRIVYSTRRRTVKTRTQVRDKHGKLVYRTVRHKVVYTVLVRDDRLRPERAIRAAAIYLAGLEQRYGGRDWAIWAYHCGEGCIADFQAAARSTKGLDNPLASVAKVFFSCSPIWNRQLYEAIHAQMDRDYSPTYWFRVMRAEQLLGVYAGDPTEFVDLVKEYRYRADSAQRAPDRLSVWLRPEDLIYETEDTIRNEGGGRLVTVPDDPAFLGYRIIGLGFGTEVVGVEDVDNCYLAAMPSTVGTLAYIAFETRRLFEGMSPGGEAFEPLDVTALVLPLKGGSNLFGAPLGGRAADHSSGEVFDLSVARLPGNERECLQFVLDDLGWMGYLGFIEEPPGSQRLHIGCSPSSRDFFARVFDDMQGAMLLRSTPPPPILPTLAPPEPPEPN
jgi:Transglycosylase SLT domain